MGYGRRTTCVPALGSARVKPLGSWSRSWRLGSWARLGLARPDDLTGRSWAALLGEPLDSADEFGGRDMVCILRGSRLADDDAARLESPIHRRLTPIRRRAEEKPVLVGGLGVETESIARCTAIMCRCENLIELEVLLKFFENSKISYIVIII